MHCVRFAPLRARQRYNKKIFALRGVCYCNASALTIFFICLSPVHTYTGSRGSLIYLSMSKNCIFAVMNKLILSKFCPLDLFIIVAKASFSTKGVGSDFRHIYGISFAITGKCFTCEQVAVDTENTCTDHRLCTGYVSS